MTIPKRHILDTILRYSRYDAIVARLITCGEETLLQYVETKNYLPYDDFISE